MTKTKRLFLSDLHLGRLDRPPVAGEYSYIRLKTEATEACAAFLRWVRNSGEFQEVVLVGDILDRWCYPVDVVPPSYEQIVEAPENQEIAQAIRDLACTPGITTVYLPGNHDQDIDRTIVNRLFPGMVFIGDGRGRGVFRRGRLRAEHGSAFSLFNGPDPFNASVTQLPLGYFIERVWASHARKNGFEHHSGLGWFSYIDDLFRCTGPMTLAARAFELFLREAELDLETPFLGVPEEFDPSGTITARRVLERYQNLYQQRENAGPDEAGRTALGAVLADISLGRIADDLCRQGDANVIIFGHSHAPEIDLDWVFVEDRIYANCGTWCSPERPRTFIVTEGDRERDRHIVREMEWTSGAPRLRKEAWVWLSSQGE